MTKESISIIIIGLVILTGFLMLFLGSGDLPEPQKVCPSDLKLCPTGEYVGRVLPDCDFIKCGQDADTAPTNAEETSTTTLR